MTIIVTDHRLETSALSAIIPTALAAIVRAVLAEIGDDIARIRPVIIRPLYWQVITDRSHCREN